MGYKKNLLPFDPIKFQQINYDSRQTKYVLKDPDKKFNWCGLQKVGNIDRFVKSYPTDICYNSSDCANGNDLRYCNHDYDIFGTCEYCNRLKRNCTDNEFLCERGEKSCIETCLLQPSHEVSNSDEDVNDFISIAPTVDFIAPMVVPFCLFVATALLVSWLFLKWICSLELHKSKTEDENKERTKTELEQGDVVVIPNWLQNRKEMIFSESAVLKGQQLGKGQFGNVMKGVLLQGNAKFPIAIKTPSGNAPKETELLLEEAKNMLRLKRYHDHIVNLQGISYKLDDDGKGISSVSLLLEYCCNGDLKSFLIKHKNEIEKLLLQFDNFGWMDDTSSKNLTTFSLDARMLHRWVYQIADGMEYLTGKGIYHGDLAARNVLLTENLDVKISDFGISHRLYSNLPQKLLTADEDGPVILPIFWLAFEVLTKYEIVPIKSDVWSFGVTVWEIFSIGKNPYWKGLDLANLIEGLSLGKRLMIPSLCPKSIGNMIQECFDLDPEKRPNFTEIKDTINLACQSLYYQPTETEEMLKNSKTEHVSLQNSSNASMQTRYLQILNGNIESQLVQENASSSSQNLEMEENLNSQYTYLYNTSSEQQSDSYFDNKTYDCEKQSKNERNVSSCGRYIELQLAVKTLTETEVIIHEEPK